jgi:hypothetical protein
MKPEAVFLRTECKLPEGLGLVQEKFNHSWMSARNMTSTVLDAAIRGAGWHFLWLVDRSSGCSFGLTVESATRHATVRALVQVKARFNAAELESVHVARYPRFWIARATLSTHHIQEAASLSAADQMSIRQLAPL